MKLKATLTLIAASLFLAACDQSGSANKRKCKSRNSKTSGNNTFVYCTAKAPLSFSPALVMEGTSYNASSQQVYNRLVNSKRFD